MPELTFSKQRRLKNKAKNEHKFRHGWLSKNKHGRIGIKKR